MNAYIHPDKRLVQVMKEEVFKQIWKTIQINKVADLLAVKRFFGVGPKRMAQFLQAMAETHAEVDSWIDEDTYEQRVREELKRCDVDYNWLMSDNVKMSDCRRRKPEQLLIGERDEILSKAKEFKRFMEMGK